MLHPHFPGKIDSAFPRAPNYRLMYTSQTTLPLCYSRRILHISRSLSNPSLLVTLLSLDLSQICIVSQPDIQKHRSRPPEEFSFLKIRDPIGHVTDDVAGIILLDGLKRNVSLRTAHRDRSGAAIVGD